MHGWYWVWTTLHSNYQYKNRLAKNSRSGWIITQQVLMTDKISPIDLHRRHKLYGEQYYALRFVWIDGLHAKLYIFVQRGEIGSVHHAIYYAITFKFLPDTCRSHWHGSINKRAVLWVKEFGQLQPEICRWPSHGVHRRRRFVHGLLAFTAGGACFFFNRTKTNLI